RDATVPARMAADHSALRQVADRLLAARFPILLAEYTGRTANGFNDLIALADTVGAAVYDTNGRLNFPNRHPLNVSMDRSVFREAALILPPAARDWEKPPHHIERTKRTVEPLYPADCELIEIGFADIGISKWSMDYTRMPNCRLRVLGDTATAIPELTKICADRIAKDERLPPKIARRASDVKFRHDGLFSKWERESLADWDASPITLPRLAQEMGGVIKTEDWVLPACTLQDWVLKLWTFDKPYRHAGRALGTGTQIGVSLGVALAHRDKG